MERKASLVPFRMAFPVPSLGLSNQVFKWPFIDVTRVVVVAFIIAFIVTIAFAATLVVITQD